MTPESISETLIQALRGFDAAMRRLNPLALPEIREELLVHLQPLAAARQALPAILPGAIQESVRSALLRACDFISSAIKGFANDADLQRAYIEALRAARKQCRAQEALFALCGVFPEVNRYFLPAEGKTLPMPAGNLSDAETGIFHIGADQNLYERGGYSLYIPEAYTPQQAWPLIIALHGGYSHGRDFLFTWLREARSRGYILFAPTSSGMSWSITHAESDGHRLARHLEEVSSRVNIDRNRTLLTGMSDGGTYALELALSPNSPFRFVAPVACALPPVDLRQVGEKHIFWIHGAQDWIFPVSYAVLAGKKLLGAGAGLQQKIVRDLSHTYPTEENSAILQWFEESSAKP